MHESRIRNFSIIAHIDHGKSTLADRVLELTDAVSAREMREQVLDSMELERERGITIKAQAVRVMWEGHELNLIDTPGHVDFTHEVSRLQQAGGGPGPGVDPAQGLDARRYPVTHTESVALAGPRWNPTVVARASLHGATRELRFPAAVVEDGRRLTIIARFSIRQSDFGIAPFAVLGGGLRVRNSIEIRIRIVARRAAGRGSSG